MSLNTAITKLLNISHPILLAAMGIVADAQLTNAVRDGGGWGFWVRGTAMNNGLPKRNDYSPLLDISKLNSQLRLFLLAAYFITTF
jgi:NAD(P)H-dependent flavin oxidoreductase YrpB (nitropropane dioxygenase family)